MELLTLNPVTLQPEDLIENYESLLWVERYSKYGDFQLITTEISKFINLLPLESYVSLRETTVPMIVEIHKIEKPKNQAPYLTITGRSFETVLERRGSVRELEPSGVRVAWQEEATKESDAAYQAMRQVIGDIDRGVSGLGAIAPAVSALDAIPEVDLTLPADYEPSGTNKYEIKPGSLYSTVTDLLKVNRRGLKAVRPDQAHTQIGIEIYNGANLISEVQFDARFDQFDKAKYLLSHMGETNIAYVYDSTGATLVKKTAADEPSGLARRVLVVDSVSETIGDDELRTSRGLVELYKYNATALFDGEISEQIAAGYNSEYFLGDIVQLVGEYGLSENVRVAEFIRVSDNTGEKAYPAFETIDA